MEDLIEALQIFNKYCDERWPTHCEHDVLWIIGVGEDDPTEQEKERLKELGFFVDNDGGWKSYRFGSA